MGSSSITGDLVCFCRPCVRKPGVYLTGRIFDIDLEAVNGESGYFAVQSRNVYAILVQFTDKQPYSQQGVDIFGYENNQLLFIVYTRKLAPGTTYTETSPTLSFDYGEEQFDSKPILGLFP